MANRGTRGDCHFHALEPWRFLTGLFSSMATTIFSKKILGLETGKAAGDSKPVNSPANTFPKKPKIGSSKSKKREIPEGIWRKCPKCSVMLYDKELDENLKVCLH